MSVFLKYKTCFPEHKLNLYYNQRRTCEDYYLSFPIPILFFSLTLVYFIFIISIFLKYYKHLPFKNKLAPSGYYSKPNHSIC